MRSAVINGTTKGYPGLPPHMFKSHADPSDDTNPNKDLKVISVAGIQDGLQENEKCEPWGTPGSQQPYWRGSEQFSQNYNFSSGLNKFAAGSARRQKRDSAFVDLVVPASALFHGDGHNTRKYTPNGFGTSQGVAIVAGVVGLMRSTDEYLGVDLVNGLPILGQDVHRKAYDILTFTANKIQDFENFLGTNSATHFHPDHYNGQDWQYDYVLQPDDPLHRTWAQRMGFGKVNAYRAVAHSIPLKGAYSYYTSQTLAFDSDVKNEDNKMLMHFGSWKNDEDKVLEVGGVSLPGESHNNQGLTIVNAEENEPTVLTVTNNRILAIDGIVRQTDETKHLNMIQATGTGKILVEGMLDNVALKGTLKIGDVIVNSTADVSGTQCGFLVPQGSSEIYGNVRLMNHGNIKLETNFNTLYVMPGGMISVEGDDDFVLGAGTRLTLKSAATLKTSTGRSIKVESGAYLNAGANSGDDVEIDGKIIVKNGGTLSVTTGCTLRIKDFVIQKGGKIKLWQGARLILTRDGKYYCYGHFISEGAPSNKVNVTAREGCPYPVGDDVVGTATLMVEGEVHSNYSQDESSFDVVHTNFENVLIKLIDVERKDIDNNRFIANPNIEIEPDTTLVGDLDGHLLYIYNINAPDYPLSSLMNVSITECQFEKSGSLTQQLGPLNGIYISELSNASGSTSVIISQTEFTSYPTAITSYGNGPIKVMNSEFASSSIKSYNTFLTVCSNAFTGIYWDTAVSCWYAGADIYDNDFSSVQVGVLCAYGYNSYFRGNSFTNYNIGIYSLMHDAYLQSVSNGAGNYKILGRNVFTSTEDEMSGSVYDIVIENADAVDVGNANAFFECGYNDFNSSSTLHVKLLSIDSLSTRSYNGSNNHWRSMPIPPPAPPLPAFPRVSSNITVTGTPYNQSLTAEPFCGTYVKNTMCYTGSITGNEEQTGPQPIRQNVRKVHQFIDDIRAINNPFNKELSITMNVIVGGHYHLHIFDAIGKVVYYNNILIEQQQQVQHNVSTSQWTNGSYYVRLSNGAETKSINVIKE